MLNNETWSITICESGENHAGMEIIGKKADSGFTVNDLSSACDKFMSYGFKCEYIDLRNACSEQNVKTYAEEAGVLIIRNALPAFESNEVNLINDIRKIETDKQYFDVRRNKVLNKQARHNICFGYVNQEPDIENKKGRVVNINSIPDLSNVIKFLPYYLGPKAQNLIGELNHYYNISKCGIGDGVALSPHLCWISW